MKSVKAMFFLPLPFARLVPFQKISTTGKDPLLLCVQCQNVMNSVLFYFSKCNIGDRDMQIGISLVYLAVQKMVFKNFYKNILLLIMTFINLKVVCLFF